MEKTHDIEKTSAHLISIPQLKAVENLDEPKGESCEAKISDDGSADERYQQELQNPSIISDEQTNRNITLAIETDYCGLQVYPQEDNRLCQQHEFAQQHHNGEVGSGPVPNKDHGDLDTYGGDPVDKWQTLKVNGPEAETSEFADETDTIAESSSLAAMREVSAPQVPCRACHYYKPYWEIVQAPCGHEYCHACISVLYEAAIHDESLFPPQCCQQPVTLATVEHFLTSDIILSFKKKEVQYGTVDRTHCHIESCTTFIQSQHIVDGVATCPDCAARTCTICKGANHEGDCFNEPLLQGARGVERERANAGVNRAKSLDQDVQASNANQALPNSDALAQAIQSLRRQDECRHNRWKALTSKGGYLPCMVCNQGMPDHVFRCTRCRLWSCDDCRKHRLGH